PGDAVDLIGRLYAQALTARLGQPVVVENRPASGRNLAGDLAAHSPPDGYTLFHGPDNVFMSNPHIYGHMPFDPFKDLVPVTSISDPGARVDRPRAQSGDAGAADHRRSLSRLRGADLARPVRAGRHATVDYRPAAQGNGADHRAARVCGAARQVRLRRALRHHARGVRRPHQGRLRKVRQADPLDRRQGELSIRAARYRGGANSWFGNADCSGRLITTNG